VEETVTPPQNFALEIQRNNDVNIDVNNMLYAKNYSFKNMIQNTECLKPCCKAKAKTKTN